MTFETGPVMKRFFAFACALACAVSAAAADLVVRGGKSTDQAFFLTRSRWIETENGLTGTGTDNPVMAGSVYRPDSFEVEATLAFAELSGGAARVFAGDVVCGIDGSGHHFFLESPAGSRALGPCVDKIAPGKPFTVRIRGEKGTLSYFVNGELLGECAYPTAGALAIGIGPWRSTLSIRDFSVSGTAAGKLRDTLPVRVFRKLVPIGRDGEILFDQERVPDGNYSAKLSSVNGGTPLAVFQAAIADGRTTIRSEVLRRAYLAAGGAHNTRSVEFEADIPGFGMLRQRLVLTDPERKTVPARGSVVWRNGRGSFAVNGVATGSFSGSYGFHHWRGLAARSLGRFGEVGINDAVYIDRVIFYIDEKGNFDRERYKRDLYERLTAVVGCNPGVRFKMFYHLYMPPEWCKAHPEECIKLDNDAPGLHGTPEHSFQPSYASQLWRRQMGEILAESIRIMQQSPFADRMPYIRICYGNGGEWNHYGYHEKAYVDFSEPMRRAFAEYLRRKYRTVEALRKAWNSPDADFDSPSLIPTREQRLAGGDFIRGNGAAGMPVVDYYEFFREFAADTVIYFARIAKKASRGQMLVGAYYGYYFGHWGSNPYHFQDSGHYALSRIAGAKEIDFVGGPSPYNQRELSMIPNGVSGTLRLAGKLWESENDERTHHSGEAERRYGTTESLAESIAVCRRNAMMNFAAGNSFYYYDFNKDWYRDPEYMATIRRLKEIEGGLRAKNWKNPAKLAIVFSESTVPYLTSGNGNKLLLQQRYFFTKQLPCLGMPCDFYLTGDLPKINFKQYTAVLFPNAFFADDKLIGDVRRYAAGGGRTLVFFHSPGLATRRNEPDVRQSEKLTGIRIGFDPEAVSGPIVCDLGKVEKKPVRFRTTVDDAEAKVLCRWADGAPAAAEKQFDNWKSVVICHHAPSISLLRNILQASGTRYWSSGRAGLNQCSFAGPLVSMYTRKAGKQTIWLPRKVEIAVDLFTGEVLRRNGYVVDFVSPEVPHTRVIFAGSLADYRKYFEPGTDK